MPAITEGSQTTKKAPITARHEAADGIRVNPGPFIGYVKNNIDPKRSGRLSVWIPELGGDEGDPSSWRIVEYCTPFYGVTPRDIRGEDQSFTGSPHSYGMWFVPPDVGVQVMCIFVNGDPFRGYWFACVPEWPNLHMIPGISSASWHGGGPEPVVEYNDNADESINPDFHKKASTPHSYQQQVWARQGLLQDPHRGPGISSAFRESPSRVFGITTPGPETAIPSGPDPNNENSANISVQARQGGHQFIMDDGDAKGNSQLIKLRTSNGNMLLLNDSAGIVYLINSSGSAWFEMDGAGNVRVYSQAKVEMHATAGFVLETPASFNITGGQIDISATGPVKISGSTVDISGKSGVKVGGQGELHLSGSKSYLSGKSCVGIKGGQHIDLQAGCITLNTKKVTEAKAPAAASPGKGPTHEPFGGHVNSKTNSPASSPSYAAASGLPAGASGNYGAAASFGATANTPEYYGVLTNQNGPIKFNMGFQGSLAGQGSNLGAAASLNTYDQNSVSYVAVGLDLPTAKTGFAVNTRDPSLDTTGLTPGEAANNPGNLRSLAEDPFAIGQSNGLNVYATPEDGIAALSVLLDLIQADGAEKLQDFIKEYINRRGR